jgi:hypothetical protein
MEAFGRPTGRESQDVEDGRADAALPAAWQREFRSNRNLRKSQLVGTVAEIINY